MVGDNAVRAVRPAPPDDDEGRDDTDFFCVISRGDNTAVRDDTRLGWVEMRDCEGADCLSFFWRETLVPSRTAALHVPTQMIVFRINIRSFFISDKSLANLCILVQVNNHFFSVYFYNNFLVAFMLFLG